MKETIIQIIENSVQEHLLWDDYTIEADETGGWSLTKAYSIDSSDSCASISIQISINEFDDEVDVTLIPSRVLNNTDLWTSPEAFVALNKANSKISNHCKFIVYEFNASGYQLHVFSAKHTPISYDAILSDDFVIINTVERLISAFDRGFDILLKELS